MRGDARYVYGATGLISQVTVADTYYYLADGLGSTMVTTDSAGDVANAYTYDVFGAPRSQTGAQANEFEFAGEQVDASTGLQYLRARYYDFEAGRFISREPLAFLPGWGGHPFGYASANPARLTDPTGLIPLDGSDGGSCSFGCWIYEEGALPGWWIERWYEDLFAGTDNLRACRMVGEYKRCSDNDVATRRAWLEILDYFQAAISYRVPKGVSSRAIDVRATKAARDMMKAKRWTADDYNRVKTAKPFTDRYGNTVWARRNGDTYEWIVERPDGVIISARKGEGLRSAELARDAFGWRNLP